MDGPNGLEAPPPGQPSFWAHADSFETHPSYDPAQQYPDIGFVYLDRKAPFDPLPGLLVEANRATLIKLDGAAPNPNSCFGDSGSPLLIADPGQTYVAGVPDPANWECFDTFGAFALGPCATELVAPNSCF